MFTTKPLINKSFMVQDFFNYNEICFKFEQVKIVMSTIYIQKKKKHNCFIVVAITVNISIILLYMYTFYFFLYVFALHVGEKRNERNWGN